jgi:hypothetical protein
MATKISPPGGGSDSLDSLYNDEPESAAPEQPGKGESVDQEEERTSGNTALVPMKVVEKLLGHPPKEGDSVTMQVAALYDDEVELKAATEPTEPGESEGEKGGVDDYAREFAAMDQKE